MYGGLQVNTLILRLSFFNDFFSIFNERLLEFCVEDVSECSTEDFEHELTKYVHFKSLPFKLDNVLEMNASLTQELTLRQAAVDADEEIVVDAVYEAAITALAKLTAHSIQVHLVKNNKIFNFTDIAQNGTINYNCKRITRNRIPFCLHLFVL